MKKREVKKCGGEAVQPNDDNGFYSDTSVQAFLKLAVASVPFVLFGYWYCPVVFDVSIVLGVIFALCLLVCVVKAAVKGASHSRGVLNAVNRIVEYPVWLLFGAILLQINGGNVSLVALGYVLSVALIAEAIVRGFRSRA
ncbi:MAG: hypothetical protein NC339_02605 [Muribaculaceae bacterium]|nr:hypothetical protein [Muribaculaceae bacterium]